MSNLTICPSCNTYKRLLDPCSMCNPMLQELQPAFDFVPQTLFQQAFVPQQQVLQAPTFAHFSNGQILHGMDPMQPMVPGFMLELAPQFIPMTPLVATNTLVPVQPAMTPLSPIFIQQPPVFSQMGAPLQTLPFAGTLLENEGGEENCAAQLLEVLSSRFEGFLNQFHTNRCYWQEDYSVNKKFEQFLDSAQNAYNTFVQADEDIYETASAWARQLGERLNICEQLEQRNYDMTTAFIEVLMELLKLMERVGRERVAKSKRRNTNPSDLHLTPEERPVHKMIATFQACLMYLLRSNFDSQGVFESCGLEGLEDLKSAVQAFKKAQMFPLSISSLQTHQKKIKHSDLESVHSFEMVLREEYAFWEQNVKVDRLSIWTEVAWEMVQLIKRELKKNRKAGEVGGVQRVVNACLDCLNFLKSDSFDSIGETEFNGYEGTRHLQIFCLLFKFMALPGFCASQSRRNINEKDDRGKKVLRYRCKRMVGFGREAYQLGKFWLHIMATGIVDLEGCYFVRDHKAEDKDKKNNQPRKLSGILFYWILSSAAESEKLLKLFVAWCEPKYRRDQAFRLYPELYKLQLDNLTAEEDRRRSHKRQKMVRKLNSMAPEPQYTYTFVKNKSGVMKQKKKKLPPTQKELEEHNEQEGKIREILCGKGHWSEEALQHQKLMYHFTFALKNEDQEADVPKSKKLSINLPTYGSHGELDFTCSSIAGC